MHLLIPITAAKKRSCPCWPQCDYFAIILNSPLGFTLPAPCVTAVEEGGEPSRIKSNSPGVVRDSPIGVTCIVKCIAAVIKCLNTARVEFKCSVIVFKCLWQFATKRPRNTPKNEWHIVLGITLNRQVVIVYRRDNLAHSTKRQPAVGKSFFVTRV